MKIIFFGTPDYVLPVLEKLHKYYEIVAVVTQSPKPMGRKKILTYSSVDNWAYKHSLASSAGKTKIPKFYDFSNLPKADMGICAAFGMIIPKVVLNHFKYGILNIHPSLLPKYRGASPIQSAIVNGDTTTGVTIIKMDEKMDHGPILTSFKEEILPDDTFETLRIRLFERSVEVLLNLIPNFVKGKIHLKPQGENLATFCKIVSKQDGFINLEKDSPKSIEAKQRAYSPWPGIWTNLKNGKRLKILKCHLEKDELILEEVQLEGKGPVSWNQFKSAYQI
jgi:methionyl-tRNA formyltransferase